jgi:hypothetical protein
VTQPTRRGGWPGPRKEFWGFKPTPEVVAAVARYMTRHGINPTQRGSRTKALNELLATHPEATEEGPR